MNVPRATSTKSSTGGTTVTAGPPSISISTPMSPYRHSCEHFRINGNAHALIACRGSQPNRRQVPNDNGNSVGPASELIHKRGLDFVYLTFVNNTPARDNPRRDPLPVGQGGIDRLVPNQNGYAGNND